MFEILRMGCNTIHDSNFSVNRPNGYEWHLLLLVKSPAVFFIDGKSIKTPADTLIIFDRNHPHYYTASEGEYKNDWVHFEMDISFFNQYRVPLNTPLSISNTYYISDLIKKMANEFYSNNPYKELTINVLMQILFIKTKEQMEIKDINRLQSKIHEELIKLRSEIYSNPQNNWSIPLMADKVHVSCGYLQNIYKDMFNITCMSDVIESRNTLAKELLIESHLPIREISSLCGFKNDVHFMRQFKKLTHITPTQYRKLNSGR